MNQTIKIKINIDVYRIQDILSRGEHYKLEYIQHYIDWNLETCTEVMRVLENEMMSYFTSNKNGKEEMEYMTALYLFAKKQKTLLKQSKNDKKVLLQASEQAMKYIKVRKKESN